MCSIFCVLYDVSCDLCYGQEIINLCDKRSLEDLHSRKNKIINTLADAFESWRTLSNAGVTF